MATKKNSAESKVQSGQKGKRRYSKQASQKVAKSMREWKTGKLKSGKSGKKVSNRKQAIAIGLSEARKSGAKVPKSPKSK